MAKKGQKFKRYSIDLKRQVVMEKLNEDTPIIELTNKYNISSQETVIRWIQNYQICGEEAFIDKRGTATAATSPLKGRPRKNFATDSDRKKYEALVAARDEMRAKDAEEREKAKAERKARRGY